MEPNAVWSPYLVGALIGVLAIATLVVSDKPLGASSAYAQIAGFVGRWISRRHTDSLKYFRDLPPKVDWGLMLLVGIVIGAALAAATGGGFDGRWVPALWQERFGDAATLRLVAAFLGGAVLAFGARLAGGCTSGHGISGALQLSLGSWIALCCFFMGAVLAAGVLYGF